MSDVADVTVSGPDDSRLVRQLRRQLKDANRSLAELRAQQPEQTKRGEKTGEADTTPAGLRQALNRAQARINELEGAQRAQSLQATFDAAGVPTGELRDLLGAKVEDVSQVTVEGLQDWMRNNGIQRHDPATEQRVAATQAIDDLRASAAPVGSQKLRWQDFQQLQQADPGQAATALAKGQVHLPPHIASQVQANRDERDQYGAR